ncbi:hypothetical protein K491DRAFT_450626 [Lophiostoma macrostomum CBS 122681]|uniref:C2H2-type domain-containing protein n=1 Tax=Lophiostoma macrostomum CBS 122681 TaxID=1314788 RepID=A0A6A6TMP3_9PLEO|nr:hypothetical protein K491DRAFT_450626 [Lophiostoma macrostomum CBS 122681]
MLKRSRTSSCNESGSPFSEIRQQSSTSTSPGSGLARSPRGSDGVVICLVGACQVPFFGKYAKGNCARHRRQFHGLGTNMVVCEETGCERTFKRKDARLKHYRKHHPHRAGALVQRRA